MKEEALALVAKIDDPVRKLNILREYVQAFVLRSLHESEAFTAIAFLGGTALRFFENVPRFSEDLDFSRIAKQRYEPEKWLKRTKQALNLSGFDSRISWKGDKTVNVAWIRVTKLLKEAGLTSRAEQNLSIKLEIDTRPPEGAMIMRSIVSRHLTFAVAHYSLSSLFAGKIHALVTRPYSKGRDWFDLVWFSGRKPPIEPNLTLLQNALDQTQGPGRLNAADWAEYLTVKLATLNINALKEDVSAFLERPEDRLLLTEDNLRAALRAFESPSL